MNPRTRAALPAEAAAIDLFALVLSGALDRAEHRPDGSWSVTTALGQTVTLARPEDAAQFIDRQCGTGRDALVYAPAAGAARTRR
ncbi:hypothetical protein I5Q34_34060 [Streptomyces sp. AV19]|uniref:hypothetical protein n=1 Tax=Streptomyces sp. AV19 TaxID=2793068 RepID=UPI0018FE4FBF|nr:hypothetical protein [Streptomyces sp. AV19]MBH1939226.1 hypothetical protein [Streptomyces sp. AV19]MDG4537192.1 hypothetical protein [Streptomyces sp. AV19]